LRITNF